MPPNMDFLDRLRLTRVYIVSKIDETTEEFDRECLFTLKALVEHTISMIEFYRLFILRR